MCVAHYNYNILISFLQALSGHFSLDKADYAEDDDVTETGTTVKVWRDKVKAKLDGFGFDGDRPNKYSGYVYDAVWLYAQSLDRLIRQNKSYTTAIGSNRSISKYIDIISKMDFNGVSGRINFPNHGHARLSNIKVLYNH